MAWLDNSSHWQIWDALLLWSDHESHLVMICLFHPMLWWQPQWCLWPHSCTVGISHKGRQHGHIHHIRSIVGKYSVTCVCFITWWVTKWHTIIVNKISVIPWMERGGGSVKKTTKHFVARVIMCKHCWAELPDFKGIRGKHRGKMWSLRDCLENIIGEGGCF